MYKDFILRFGLPKTNHHDQGCIFENKLFYNLDKLIGGCFLEQHCTMRKRNNKWKDSDRAPDSKWCDHLNKVVHAYNRAQIMTPQDFFHSSYYSGKPHAIVLT